MNNDSIAEHLIYLVEQHNKVLQQYIVNYEKELSLAFMSEYSSNNTTTDLPENFENALKKANKLLVDRVQALLENRS